MTGCMTTARRLDHHMDMAAVRPGRKLQVVCHLALGVRDDLLEFFRHAQMLLEMGERLAGPGF